MRIQSIWDHRHQSRCPGTALGARRRRATGLHNVLAMTQGLGSGTAAVWGGPRGHKSLRLVREGQEKPPPATVKTKCRRRNSEGSGGLNPRGDARLCPGLGPSQVSTAGVTAGSLSTHKPGNDEAQRLSKSGAKPEREERCDPTRGPRPPHVPSEKAGQQSRTRNTLWRFLFQFPFSQPRN